MAVAKLTKTYVADLPARDKTYIDYDAELPGFGVLVTKGGHKSWIVEYRPRAGGRRAQKRRITLGSTATLTSDKARKEAKDMLARARLGADPAEERRETKAAATIAELADEFLKPSTRVNRKESTRQLYDLYFRVHILPELGTKSARDVSRADVARLHRKIGATKPSTANRVVVTLSGLFSWAIKSHLVRRNDNPAKDIDLFSEKSRERFLSTEELAKLGEALREAETVGLTYEVDETKPKAKHAPRPENRRTVADPFAVAAIRLLLLTGARLREVLHLRWSEVDIERGFLNLGDSKTGQKTVVLNAPAMTVLSSLPRVGIYVIAGRSAGTDDERPRTDLHRPWAAITKRAGLKGLRIHDLRHTHGSFGAVAGVGLPLIGKILGHQSPETTAKYVHFADDPLRRASERIGGDLAAAMGEPLPEKAEIVQLRGRSS